jgi:hypothetical protein
MFGKHTKALRIIVYLLFLPTSGALAQSYAGAIFLLISPSATLNGLGQIGAAYPTNDLLGMYFNPANFPEMSTGLSARYGFLARTPWLENLSDNMSLRSQSGQIGFQVASGILAASLGGYRTYLDLGTQDRTDEYGEKIGTFHFYMFAQVLAYGVRMHLGGEKLAFRVSMGGATKKAVQRFESDRVEATEAWHSEDKLTDFGLLAELPVTVQFDEVCGSLRFRPTVGYSISNYGDAISYSNHTESDPPPTTVRLGYSLRISAGSKSGRYTLLSVGIGREVEDLLVKMKSDHTDWYLDRPLADIDVGKHLLKGELGRQVTLHEGQEVTILDIVSLRIGKYTDISGKLEFITRGYGISGRPLLQFFLGSFRHPIARFLAQQVDIRYNESEEEGSLRDGTTYQSISFIIGPSGK